MHRDALDDVLADLEYILEQPKAKGTAALCGAVLPGIHLFLYFTSKEVDELPSTRSPLV